MTVEQAQLIIDILNKIYQVSTFQAGLLLFLCSASVFYKVVTFIKSFWTKI